MVKHIVLFKLKDKKDIQCALDALNGMKGKIEGLIGLEAGSDFLSSERSYDVALTCTLMDKAALDFYQSHPVHQPVKKLMHEIRESSVAVDYEIKSDFSLWLSHICVAPPTPLEIIPVLRKKVKIVYLKSVIMYSQEAAVENRDIVIAVRRMQAFIEKSLDAEITLEMNVVITPTEFSHFISLFFVNSGSLSLRRYSGAPLVRIKFARLLLRRYYASSGEEQK